MSTISAFEPAWGAQALLVAALLLPPASVAAKPRTLEWDDGSCGYTMRYDDAKVDAKALESTVDLLKGDAASVPTTPFVRAPHEVKDLDVGKFETDCAASAAAIRDAPLLAVDGVEDFRRGRIELIEDACRFGSAAMRGLSDPAAFRSYAPAAQECGFLVDALEGKTDLTTTWRKLGDDLCDGGGLPESCLKTFESSAKMGPGDSGMRLTVGVFGWNNCAANHTKFNGEDAERLAELGKTVLATFNKTYRVKSTCEN